MSRLTHHNMLQKVIPREAMETDEVLCEVTPLRRLLNFYQNFEGSTNFRLVFSCQSTRPTVPGHESIYHSRCEILKFREGYNLYFVA
jgi:hypothetical protein